MGRFASPEKQAASVLKVVQGRGNVLPSVGTVHNYEKRLTIAARYAIENRLGGLRGMTPDDAVTYLEIRGKEVGKKTLDMDRLALQMMMQHVTHKLDSGQKLPVIKSEHKQVLKSRAYKSDQVKQVSSRQADKYSLATRIAYASGLRAHEFFSLRPVAEQAMSNRPSHGMKFTGRNGDLYTVIGKGGLIREVMIPSPLARQLEERRLEIPRRIDDRGIHYQQFYAIGAGQGLSNSFSAASRRAVGWSAGFHGLRHGYAQERMKELQIGQLQSYDAALLIVSQEMGHFRPDITEVYLR